MLEKESDYFIAREFSLNSPEGDSSLIPVRVGMAQLTAQARPPCEVSIGLDFSALRIRVGRLRGVGPFQGKKALLALGGGAPNQTGRCKKHVYNDVSGAVWFLKS